MVDLRKTVNYVFSTSVEVFPRWPIGIYPAFSLLHVRGGVSKVGVLETALVVSSPRPWRCFPTTFFGRQLHEVFSTSVEVFP